MTLALHGNVERVVGKAIDGGNNDACIGSLFEPILKRLPCAFVIFRVTHNGENSGEEVMIPITDVRRRMIENGTRPIPLPPSS